MRTWRKFVEESEWLPESPGHPSSHSRKGAERTITATGQARSGKRTAGAGPGGQTGATFVPAGVLRALFGDVNVDEGGAHPHPPAADPYGGKGGVHGDPAAPAGLDPREGRVDHLSAAVR